MLNIFICDDDIAAVEKLKQQTDEYCTRNGLEYSMHSYTTGRDLLAADIQGCDLLFLDVDMGEENGIAIAHEIRKVNRDMILVYVSGYVQYAPAGYNVKAFAYILKNDLDSLFAATMDDVCRQLNFRGMVYRIKINDDEISLPLKNILYIESYDKICEIHTNLPQPKYTVRQPLNEAVNRLADKGFVQIHKSYVVNMQHITKLKNYTITLSDYTALPAAQKRWQDIMQKYLEWKGNV